MIRKISEIMIKDYTIVDSLWGLRRIHYIAEQSEIDCFPVSDNGRIIGILTRNDLMKSHPNRIVLDAMSGSFRYIGVNESVWKAKEIFYKDNADILLVTSDDEVIGIVTKQVLNYELGKHIDLLTGLSKSDYIYYRALELLELDSEISVVFFDIDNFGYIDKKFGHAIGDRILQEIATLLMINTPERGYSCRYGGDEFAMLTTYNTDDCEAFVQRLLQAIRDHKFPHNIPLSVSAGIAGGKRISKRKTDMFEMVSNLINIASLASTKAKNEKGNLVSEFCEFIDEIAI